MKGFAVGYRMQIVDVKSVTLPGVLEYDSDRGWIVTEAIIGRPPQYTARSLSEWLEKFSGKKVVITIEEFPPQPDDTELIKGHDG